MKELINNELAQLQKDLESLQSAAKMISEAGTASNTVIEEAKTIHGEFQNSLGNLTELYKQYLEEANKQAGEKQDEVVNHLKNTVSEQSKVLDSYSQLVESANQNTTDLLNKSLETQEAELKKLSYDTQIKIAEQNTLIKRNADDAAQKVEEVKATYLKQAAETDKLLTSYLELAQSTAELKDKINAIDFPERLDKITKLINQLNDEQAKTTAEQQKYNEEQAKTTEELAKLVKMMSLDKAYKQSEKNAKSIGGIKGLLWFMIILILAGFGFAAFVAFKHNLFAGLF